MRMGFILTKTPGEQGFQSFLKFIDIYLGKAALSIYLLGNGVYFARNGHHELAKFHTILNQARIIASLDDLQARGIKKEQLISGVETFENYDDFVLFLMEDLDQVLSF